LNQEAGVPIIVIAKTPEKSEAVNRMLRNGGHPAHCTLISNLDDLSTALGQINPELILLFSEQTGFRIRSVIDLRNTWAPGVPVLEVRDKSDENIIAHAMREGANDSVSLANTDRLVSVTARELRSFRLERALNQTLGSASQYKKQLQNFLDGSADAIAQVSEGIVVNANSAWLELFGYPEGDTLTGTPVMDLFDNHSHAAIKAAINACRQGKWSGHELKAQGLLSDGSNLSMALQLTPAEYEGEASVRMCVAARTPSQQKPEQKIERLAILDGATSLYNRNHLITHLKHRMAQPSKGGVNALIYITVDHFRAIIGNVGPLASEDILVSFANLLRESVVKGDLYGRLGGTIFAAFINRGTQSDVEAWCKNLTKRVRNHVFEAGDKSVSATCSIGIAEVNNFSESVERLIQHADQANEHRRQQGGDGIHLFEMALSERTQTVEFDRHWVRQIKDALTDNRFHLAHLPIASLGENLEDMYDVMLRMKDDKGNEVLPSFFIPAAERKGLMRPIDRWVLGAALQFCHARRATRVFARISAESVVDSTLPEWLSQRIKAARMNPGSLCVQVTEVVAKKHLKQTAALATALGERGILFALEHFGVSNDSLRLLEHLNADYAKIDGSLMQGLASHSENQITVAKLVDSLKEHRIKSIGERVEDANTMAVLWQTGVQYIQGHYVQEHAVVLGDSAAE
jgi:diguanylate cyclase (GGDEF)-like protein/PAS domain S-box-containing protein